MRTIVIKLGDSDFHSTFENLLETIWNVIAYRGDEISNEFMDKIIREGVRFHFMAFQMREKESRPGPDLDFYDKYLHESLVILFDEEAEKYANTNGGDSGAWYLDVLTGQISYI